MLDVNTTERLTGEGEDGAHGIDREPDVRRLQAEERAQQRRR